MKVPGLERGIDPEQREAHPGPAQREAHPDRRDHTVSLWIDDVLHTCQ